MEEYKENANEAREREERREKENKIDVARGGVSKKRRINIEETLYKRVEMISKEPQRAIKILLEHYDKTLPIVEALGESNLNLILKIADKGNQKQINRLLKAFALFEIEGKTDMLLKCVQECKKTLIEE